MRKMPAEARQPDPIQPLPRGGPRRCDRHAAETQTDGDVVERSIPRQQGI